MNNFQAQIGFDLPNDKTNALLEIALSSARRGWSVIPLIGGLDASFGKHPRIRWASSKWQNASEQQIRSWFNDKTSAYGIVCGKVSKVIVVDCDEAIMQAEFIQKYPHLLDTYIVRSGIRGTLHFYFEIDFPVKSVKLRGGDLKAEGSYVVGAGSEIAGGKWEIVQDKPLYQITETELNRILVGLALPQKPVQPNTTTRKASKSPEDFRNVYRFLVKEHGNRNEALFRVGCFMRDAGYELQDCVDTLAGLHARQAPKGHHAPETEAERWAEAERSLRSVFSKPARLKPDKELFKRDASYLPNNLREVILTQKDGVAFLRVYEGLILLGYQAGEWLKEGEIKDLLAAYGIGRPSIRKALKFSVPAPKTPPTATADLSLADSHTKTCVFVSETKHDKSRHRPVTYYCIPSVEGLCEQFGVCPQGADPIELKDIQSAKHYRAALNRELIRRRPGKYSQSWLGKRLSIDRKSLQRYLKFSKIKSRFTLEEIAIDWGNINIIPSAYAARHAGMDLHPYFLQDEQGKRYPAKPEIARKLLKTGHGVWLMRRDCKEYWIEDEVKTVTLQEKFAMKQTVHEQRFLFPNYPTPVKIVAQSKSPMAGEAMPEIEQRVAAMTATKPKFVQTEKPSIKKPNFNDPLPLSSDEWLAQKMYKLAGNLQLTEARQMLHLYGKALVGKILGRMEYLKQKNSLENPAGFLKVALRSAWLVQNGFPLNRPEFQHKNRKTRKARRDAKKTEVSEFASKSTG